MRQIHNYEREQFEKLFRQEKIDRLEERLTVLDAFLQKEQHLTPEELDDVLSAQGHRLGAEFVSDTLERMCRFGFAHKNRFENGRVRYEHRHLGQHHDHMICNKCGRIMEFEDRKMEDLQRRIATDYGFHMLQHRMEIYGICSDCQAERMKQMPLILARPGEQVVIRELIGGSGSRVRLMSIGLRTGDTVEILTNYGKGQMVVAADNHRFVLGQGLAQKIIVEPVSSKDSGDRDRFETTNAPE